MITSPPCPFADTAHAGGPPVIVVHGLWDNAQRIQPLVRGLGARGITSIHAPDFPASGAETIEALAIRLSEVVDQVQTRHQTDQVRLVGFSMGALVSRTYLQQLHGAARVQTFISISGPHRGTVMAYGSGGAGIRQMRPGSALLRRLGSDVGDLPLPVHCIYTPYDMMIVPQRSAVLQGAASVHAIRVATHRWMLYDARVLNLTANLLRSQWPIPTTHATP